MGKLSYVRQSGKPFNHWEQCFSLAEGADVQEVLLHGLFIKVGNYSEALQLFSVTIVPAFMAREDSFTRQKEFFKIAHIKKKNRKKRKMRETVSG